MVTKSPLEGRYAYGSPVPEKPEKVKIVAILTLISGISNALGALIVTATIVIGSFGLGLFCAPVALLPLVLGVFELIYAANLLANPPRPMQPSSVLAILEICAIFYGNAISLIGGVLALIFYSDPEVQYFFAALNE